MGEDAESISVKYFIDYFVSLNSMKGKIRKS